MDAARVATLREAPGVEVTLPPGEMEGAAGGGAAAAVSGRPQSEQ